MNLPIEIKLDILQCLNYDQLFKLQKSNSHFYYLIDKYERNLARMKFKKMEITASFSYQNHGVIVFGIFDLPFVNLIKKAKFPSAEVKTKCQIAIDRRIPIYLCTNEPKEMFFISLFKKGLN
uniref:F-box domain-containing protein n=1 Tax=Meloidogyne hapla TaxID=6305 RepID=A0A1I8C0K5_MELHA